MAENILSTRIQLRYGTYEEWSTNHSILKSGEAAVCSFPNTSPPSIGLKFGDGERTFSQLPWLQAIAADVYSWAKQVEPPEASTIPGLENYIANYLDEHNIGGGGSGDVPVTSRIYQIIRGTGQNINKYYLQYRENTEGSQWIIDTSHYIDVDDFVKISNWIGSTDITEFPNLTTKIVEEILLQFNELNYTDEIVENQFVVAVSQNSGIISVKRARPSFADLTDYANVPQGGTGTTTFPEGHVLIGNGQNPIATAPIATEIANNEDIVPNYLVKQYVDNLTKGVDKAMHFIGEATVVIKNNSNRNPNIEGYIFTRAKPGDVILYESKEFIWDGAVWRLFGDEDTQDIKDINIAENANIQQSKIAGLSETLDTKVDKEEGKTLTSNDFTDALLQKLQGIEEEAQCNTIEHILINGKEQNTEYIPSLKTANLSIREFDIDSQNKLENIEDGAEVNKIEGVQYGDNLLTPVNKIIHITPEPQDPHTEHINVIESIAVNGNVIEPDNNKQVNISIQQKDLNLDVLEGALYGPEDNRQEVEQINKKLILETIAVTGDVKDLRQKIDDTYILLDCGTSVLPYHTSRN